MIFNAKIKGQKRDYMENKRFDVILDAGDPEFTAKLIAALGLTPGETVNIMTPQFDRTDGRAITYLPNTPEEYAALKLLDADSLKKIGCQIWDKEKGKTTWLFPYEWYNHIPDGTEIVDINGDVEIFKQGETDNDMRFGALAYGFVQAVKQG
jgi:hypothetical protein